MDHTFQRDDVVLSPIDCRGTVTAVDDDGTVHVEYVDKGGRSESIHTPEWFLKYPGMLKPAPAWMLALPVRPEPMKKKKDDGRDNGKLLV